MYTQETSETSPLLVKQRWPSNSSLTVGVFANGDDAPQGLLQHKIYGENGHASRGEGGKYHDACEDEAVETPGSILPDADVPAGKHQLRYIVPAVAIGVFLSACDQTIIASSYGRIGSELHALNITSWIATAYFLTLSSFQPLYGKLSDIFSRKSALLLAYTVFGLGCVFCGLSQSMGSLIFWRAFSGVGGGGMTTVVSILISDLVPLRERGTWQGVLNIIYATGAGIGAPLGGVFADYLDWRWAFISQGPLCLLAFVSVYFALHLPKTTDNTSHWKSKIKRVDFLGASILVCAVFTLLLGLDRGSNDSWSSPLTITMLAATAPLWVLFVLVECLWAAEPFAPSRIIFDGSLVAAYLCNFFSFGSWLATLFYLPLYFQAVDGLSATEAGLRLLPGIVTSVTGSLLGGFAIQKTGRYYWLTAAGFMLLTAGSLIEVLGTGPRAVASRTGVGVGLAMGGLGNGIGGTASLIALISNAPAEDQAVVTACSYLFRSLGSVVGISLLSALVQAGVCSRLRSGLRSGEDVDAIVRRVRQSLDYVGHLGPEARALVVQSYARAINDGFWLVAALAACAMFFSFLIRERRFER